MNRLSVRLLSMILVLVGGIAAPCVGRLVPDWDYDKLLADADFVAIVEPMENVPAKDEFDGAAYGHAKADFTATNTRFKIRAILKGVRDPLKEVTLLHFFYAESRSFATNGAQFIRFAIDPVQNEVRVLKDKVPLSITTSTWKPEWIAFLKIRPDGRYEPVTGQYDAALSFRALHRSFFP